MLVLPMDKIVLPMANGQLSYLGNILHDEYASNNTVLLVYLH